MLQMGTRRLQVFDIDAARAERLASTLGTEFSPDQIEVVKDLDSAMRRCDGLINTSPIGMHKYPGMPLSPSLLRPSLWVAWRKRSNSMLCEEALALWSRHPGV